MEPQSLMIQLKDGSYPQVSCSYDVTIYKIHNFMFMWTFLNSVSL